MSSAGHLSELDLLRGQVADLSRQLAERDRSMQDLRERSQLLRTIVEGTAPETGDEFFTSLVIRLTSTLHVQYAVISEVLEAPFRKIRTLAVSAGDTLIDNFEYDLDHTPCATALTQTFACFNRDLQATFPEFQRLVDLGAESYCAVPVRTKDGAVSGLLVVMDTKPLQHGDDLQSLLEVFAPRVGAEFERRRVEQERARALAEIRNVIETVPDIMFSLDTHGNMVKWNRRVEDVTGYSPEELLNMPALAFVPPEEHIPTAAAIERAFTEGYAELEGHLLTKEYRLIPYHWTGALLKNSHGVPIGITGVGRDVSAKRRAEEERQKALTLLTNVINNTPDFIFVKDRDLRTVLCNNVFAQAIGKSPEDLIGRTDIENGWDPELVRGNPDKGIRGFEVDDREALSGRVVHNHADPAHVKGEIRIFDTYKMPLLSDTGEVTGVLGVARDITERKRVEESLWQSRVSLQSFVEHTPAAVAMLDRGLKYIAVSKRWYEDYQLGDRDIIGLHHYDVFPEIKKMEHWQAFHRRCLAGEIIQNSEDCLVREDGKEDWLRWEIRPWPDTAGSIGGIIMFTEVITKRKQVEEALRASEERWQLAVQGSNDGIWDWNIQSGTIFFSPRWKAMRGFGEHEITSHVEEWQSRIHSDDLDRVLQSLDAYVAKQAPDFCEEYRTQRKDGSYMWILDRGVALWADDGTPLRMVGSESDITEHKRALLRLAEQESLLRSILDTEPECVNRVADDGTILQMNKAGLCFIESDSFEQVAGRSVFDLVAPEFLEGYRSMHEAVIRGASQQLEFQIVGLKGTRRWMEAHAVPLRNPIDHRMEHLAITHDITERKQVERALRESEERYRTLVDLSPIGVLVYSNGKKVYVNEIACRIMGADSPEQLLENPAFHFSHPDDHESIHASIAQILVTGEPVRRAERKYQRLNGTAIFVEVDAGRIMWNGEPAIQVIFADITERKRAEEELRLSEQRQELALSGANLGLWDWDLLSRKSVFDARWCSMIGYEVGELEPHVSTWRSLLHPEDELAIQPILESHLKNETPDYEAEFRMWHKAGHWIWVLARGRVVDRDQSGAPLRMAGTHMDITDRKLAQEKRYESEAQLRAILDNSPSLIFLKDCKGRYLRVNREFATAFRLTSEEIVGRTDRDIFPPEQAAIFQMNDAKVLQGGMPLLFEEASFHGDDLHIAIVHKFPLRDEKGALYAIGGIVTDITERKCAERALRESEERLRLSLEAANQGIYDLNVQTGEALVSSGYITMLDYDPATFRETNAAWIERLHPDDRERVADYYRAYVAGKIPEYRVEFRQRTRGGGWRWILSLGRIVERDARGEALRMLGTHTDITERKQAEEALREREEALARFKATLDQTHDCVFMFAPDTLRFIYCNRGAVEQVGYTEAELFSMTPLDIKPEFTEQSFRELLDSLRDGRKSSYIFETVHRHKDGHKVAVEVSLQLVREERQEGRFVAVVRDITERKQAEEALRESEERFGLAVHGSNTGIWDWDLRTSKTYFSPLWKSMLGYEEHELQGEFFEWEERLHPDDRERSSAAVRAYLDGTTPQYELEHRLRHKDGSYRWILARGVSICDTEGKPYRMAGSHIDITEQKQIQEALAQRERQLQTVLDALPVGVWFTDRTGRLLLANPAARQIWSGVRQVGIETGANAAGWWEATGPSGELHRWALSQTLTKGIPSLHETLDLECLDGTKKTIRNSTVPVRGEAGVVVGALVLNEDITSLRQAQEALRLTQFSVDHAVEAFFWIDHQGNILNVNESACRMLGHSREELITMTVHDIDPNFPPELWPTHWAELKQKGSITSESKLWSQHGRVIDTEVTVNYLHYDGREYNCAIMRDIGERRRAEDALWKSEARLRTITDAVPGAVYQYQLSADGTQRFLFLSQGIQALVGVPSAEGENDFSSIWNRILPEEVGDLWASSRQSSETLSPWRHEFRIVHADGTTRWISGNSIPESPRDDGSILWNGILIDVTDRKRMEETLRQRERDLRAAIEERERISQDLHDGILQSLFAVGLTLETTKSTMSSRSRKTSGPALDQAIKELNLVMGEIRNFIAGLGPDLLQGNDLPAALQHMLASMTQNQATRVRLAVEDRAAKALSAEQSLHLVRVIQEAVSNCIKHGRASEARVSLKMLKQGVRLSIRDNGRGFKQDADKGTGHGLRNMAARAQKLGGRFTVLSKVKEGTRIVLDLPKEVSDVSH